MTNLIALSGPKSSGKSTLAKSLTAKHPQFTRQRFAEPLKLMLGKFLEFQGATKKDIYEMLDGNQKEFSTEYFCNQTPRLAMQTLGTEWRDMIDKNLWVNAWRRAAEKELQNNQLIIVDDLRFIHEAKIIWNLNGKVIQIDRDKAIPGDHPSEREYQLIQADYHIYNTEDSPNLMLVNLEVYLDLSK